MKNKKTKWLISIVTVIMTISAFSLVVGAAGSAAPLATSLEDIVERIGDLLDELFSNENKAYEIYQEIYASLNNALNGGWYTVRLALSNDSWESVLNSYSGVLDSALAVVGVLAYSLAVLFFMINTYGKFLRYGEMGEKQALEIFLGLVGIGIWITASAKICGMIYSVNAELVETLLKSTKQDLLFAPMEIEESEGSGALVIGFIVDFLTMLIRCFPQIITSGFMVVISYCISIKLIIRQLECICLITVSPLCFACLVGEATRPYFKSFILTYIGVVFETLFMALVYIYGLSLYNQKSTEVLGVGSLSLTTTFVVIAIGIMMIKPPRVLTNLVKA